MTVPEGGFSWTPWPVVETEPPGRRLFREDGLGSWTRRENKPPAGVTLSAGLPDASVLSPVSTT